MKLVPFQWPGEFNKKSDAFQKTVAPALKKIYGPGNPFIAGISEIFSLINPRGKTILDLGCGCICSPDSILISYSKDPQLARSYEPWLLRSLQEYGANCIGIDLGSLKGERFTGYSRDLEAENSLSVIADNSVDLACAFRLFDSPTGWIRKDLNSLSFWNSGQRKDAKTLFQKLLPQLERVVKKDGYFLFDSCGVLAEEYCTHYSLNK